MSDSTQDTSIPQDFQETRQHINTRLMNHAKYLTSLLEAVEHYMPELVGVREEIKKLSVSPAALREDCKILEGLTARMKVAVNNFEEKAGGVKHLRDSDFRVWMCMQLGDCCMAFKDKLLIVNCYALLLSAARLEDVGEKNKRIKLAMDGLVFAI